MSQVNDPFKLLRGALRANAGLLLFAVDVYMTARARQISLLRSRLTTWADWGWVAASGVLLAFFPDLLTGAGKGLVLGVALVVAGFASAQGLGLRRVAAA
jgi:hypothetical protein